MDHNKLDSGMVLAAGILSRPMPESLKPKNAVLADVEEGWTRESLRKGLEAGGLSANMYYGCWNIWKSSDGTFSGEIMQYRICTERFEHQSLAFSLDKASEWAYGCEG